jgi:hypothetical protein
MDIFEYHLSVAKKMFKDKPFFVKKLKMDSNTYCYVIVLNDSSEVSEWRMQSNFVDKVYSKNLKTNYMIYTKILKINKLEIFEILNKSKSKLKKQDHFLILLEYLDRYPSNIKIVDSCNLPLYGESLLIKTKYSETIVNRLDGELKINPKNKLLRKIEKKVNSMVNNLDKIKNKFS